MDSSTALCLSDAYARARVPTPGHLMMLDEDWVDEAQTQEVTPTATLLQNDLASRANISRELLRDWNKGQGRKGTTDTLPDAIRANWNELVRSGLSEEAYARLNLLANKPTGWRGPGSKMLSGASVSRSVFGRPCSRLPSSRS